MGVPASPDDPAPERGDTWLGPVTVLVPVKAFATAKVRLAAALGADDRAALARAMATAVLLAARPLPTAVVCDDVAVAEWARSQGALVVWEPGRGLNGAVAAGVERLREAGVRRVIVAHGDLPRAGDLARLGVGNGITLVPDRHRNGTNVVVVPSDAGFQFSYGPGSFARHLAEAERLAVGVTVIEDPRLAFDVDSPDDLDMLDGIGTMARERPR